MTKLRILIADDHELVRHGLRGVLERQVEWEVVGEATNGREAVEMAKRTKPDVVVLDVAMPEMNGLEAARQILEELPQTEVLILTMYDSEQVGQEVLNAGARGYLLKSDAARDLVAAVEALGQHKPFFTAKVSEMVLRGYLNPATLTSEDSSQRARLTAREREIVQLLAEGKSNKEIAAALSISVKTVETHRAKVMYKLGFHSLSELVRYAVRNRIIEP